MMTPHSISVRWISLSPSFYQKISKYSWEPLNLGIMATTLDPSPPWPLIGQKAWERGESYNMIGQIGSWGLYPTLQTYINKGRAREQLQSLVMDSWICYQLLGPWAEAQGQCACAAQYTVSAGFSKLVTIIKHSKTPNPEEDHENVGSNERKSWRKSCPLVSLP